MSVDTCGNQHFLCYPAKLFIVGSNSSSSTRSAVDMGKQKFIPLIIMDFNYFNLDKDDFNFIF